MTTALLVISIIVLLGGVTSTILEPCGLSFGLAILGVSGLVIWCFL